MDFLQKWAPKGPWVLTAISLDKKNITTSTFRSADRAKEWLEEHGKTRNVYFSVNTTRTDVVKKPLREDVQSMDWLHVDVDPRAGEDIQEEQKRILALLSEHKPEPTLIIFSGGGYQGFWKLKEPFWIDGKQAEYEQAKRYNLALERKFGADPCHNVDRIMRLPGTLNRPDSRKRKKGRKIALAHVVTWNGTAYPLDTFQPAPEPAATPTVSVTAPQQVKRVQDINTLSLGSLCRIVIVQGNDPDNPQRFESRSHALFYVCCEMVRAKIADDVIYSVITDPGFKISESVLDKGSSSERYALRQIKQARENAIHPQLQELNDRYAVVSFSGKIRVIYEERDQVLDRHRLVKMSFEDFRNLYVNRKVQVGTNAQGDPMYMPLGKWWLAHPNRRQYEGIAFAPGREVDGFYNLWRGFAVDPKPGDEHQLYLEHIHQNVCNGDAELFKYVLGWMARTVQKPDTAGQTALVLRGDQGVGKGFLAKMFGALFGRHFLHVSSSQRLTGNFNAHLRDCVLLFADEAFYAGDKRHASTLKTLVTEDSIMVEPKGVDSEMVANCLHIIMASNEDWVVPAGMNERRFCVLDVGNERRQNPSYFGNIARTMREGGYQTLLHYLLNYDLSTYNVRALPHTDALQSQKIHSFTPMQEWWYGKLVEGKILPDDGWVQQVLCNALVDDYVEHNRNFGHGGRRGSATQLGMFLHSVCPARGLKKIQHRESASYKERIINRPYFYELPTLQECRDHWDEHMGGPYEWPDVADSEDVPF